MKKLVFILFIFFAFVSGWGSCISSNGSITKSYTSGGCSFLGNVYDYKLTYRSSSFKGGCESDLNFSNGYSPCGLVPYGEKSLTIIGEAQSGNRYLASCSNAIYDGSSSITYDRIICDTKNEADSVNCVNDGGRWLFNDLNGMYECNTNSCDSTFTCISYPYNYCQDVPSSDDIICVNGNCYGLGGSKWVSYYDKNCTNACGAIQNTRVTGDTVYVPGGSCDDPLQCDPTTHCVDFDNGTYFLFQKCLVGRKVVGNVDERQTLAQITLSGIGTCKDNGYRSETYPNSGGGTSNPTHSQADSISSDCTIYGVGCEQYQDTTNYQDGDNANPKKCWCEPFDGINSVSYIKCPDGSSRVVYMSCEEWQNLFSSSSIPPPPSSSSAGGGASSGSLTNSSDSNPFRGKYPEYPSDQPTTNKNVQGALSGISELVISIRDHLAQLKNYIMSTQIFEFDSVESRSHGDYSYLDTVQSDLGFTFDSLFNKIDTSRKIIDTSNFVSTGTCPIIKGEFSLCKKFGIFKGNQDIDMKFDLSNFFGFNLCSIIKALVVSFTSVVVFILSFRVISKSGM